MERFRINFEFAGGEVDSFIIEAETIEEIKEQADIELDKRHGLNPWSEDLND